MLGPDGLRADADGCSVVVAGPVDPQAVLGAHLAGRAPASPALAAAVAIWDGRSARLQLIRDRTGLYPLFHAETAVGIVAGPDARALLELPNTPRELDPLALAAWLSRVDSDPEATLYRSLYRIPAGHMFSIAARRRRLTRIWEPPAEGSLELTEAEQFGETLEASIRSVSDGRAAVFLSGGIDSSAVAAAAATVSNASGVVPPLALCVEIEGASEEREQRAVAEALGMDWRRRIAKTGSDLLERGLDRAAASLWPTSSPWQPVYDDLAHDAQAGGVATILDGIGGDELLDAGLLLARRAVTHLKFGVMLDIAAAERGYVGGGMKSVLRAAAPRRHRRRWEPSPSIAARHRAALADLAAVPRDDLLRTRIAAGWEEMWDAGHRQGVTYHHPLWTADVVTLVRGLPVEALVAKGQAKSPARSYLARRIPTIVGRWPRPAVADSLLSALEREHAARHKSADGTQLLRELGVISGGELLQESSAAELALEEVVALARLRDYP